MPRNRNVRQNRNTTRVVVQSTSGNQQAQNTTRPRRQRRSTVNVNVNAVRAAPAQGQRTNPVVRVRAGWRPRRRQPGRGQHEIHQRITTTLGTVGSNSSGGVENEMTVIINPSTMKEQTGSTSFGPLGVLASQYALWKVNRIEVTLKQLVGNNAASGTVARVSAVPNTSASQVSWSSLGARRHSDVDIGKNGRFVITAKELRGPKDGWYYTNTNLDSCDACAGILQIHTLGKTMNPYQNQPYSGPLFLAEVTTDWSFKDYQQNPGMLNMVKSETAQDATIEVDSNNKILMKVGNTTGLGAYAQNPSASEVIWMVTDTVITTGADIFPAPFNWLFKGGWWIIKRIAGAPVAGESGAVYFEVFPSIADAQNNKPCYASGSSNAAVPLKQVNYQQITPSNLGTPGETLTAAPPHVEPSNPTRYYATGARALYNTNATNEYAPAWPIWRQQENVPNATQGIGVGQQSERVHTWDLYKVQVDQIAPVEGPEVYYTINTTSTPVGVVAATSHVYFQSTGSEAKDIRLTNVLFYCNQSTQATFNGAFKGMYFENELGVMKLKLHTNPITNVRLSLQSGQWYIAQYLCIGGIKRQVQVAGNPVCTPVDAWTGTPEYPIRSDQGDETKGMPPSYLSGLVFDVPTGDADIFLDAMGPSAVDQVDGFPDVDGEAAYFDNQEETLYFDEPPVEVLQVEPEVEGMYNMLVANGATHRQAALAVNQIKPSKTYEDFVARYHDSLVDGFSPAQARVNALGV